MAVEPGDRDRFLAQDASVYVEMGFTQFTLGFNGPERTVERGRNGSRGGTMPTVPESFYGLARTDTSGQATMIQPPGRGKPDSNRRSL